MQENNRCLNHMREVVQHFFWWFAANNRRGLVSAPPQVKNTAAAVWIYSDSSNFIQNVVKASAGLKISLGSNPVARS